MRKLTAILAFCLLGTSMLAEEMCFEKYRDAFPLKILEGKELSFILLALKFSEIPLDKIDDYVILLKEYEDSKGISFLNSNRFHRGEMGVTKGFREVEVLMDGKTRELLDIRVIE